MCWFCLILHVFVKDIGSPSHLPNEFSNWKGEKTRRLSRLLPRPSWNIRHHQDAALGRKRGEVEICEPFSLRCGGGGGGFFNHGFSDFLVLFWYLNVAPPKKKKKQGRVVPRILWFHSFLLQVELLSWSVDPLVRVSPPNWKRKWGRETSYELGLKHGWNNLRPTCFCLNLGLTLQ